MNLLLYLESRQIANYFKVTLRSPKRLVPAILVVLWMLMVLGPQMAIRFFAPRHPLKMLSFTMPPQISIALFAILSITMIYLVQRSFSESMVTFRLPDIDFVFPTPIRTQTILCLRLLGLYARVGVYILFFSIIFGFQISMFTMSAGLSVTCLTLALFAVFLINICTTINLIATFRGRKKWWLAFAVRGAACLLLVFVLARLALGYLQTGSVAQSAIETFRHPLVVTLLLPAKWAADLMLSPFAGWKPTFGAELAGMLALAVGSLALVLSRTENPYEPSLGISVRAAAVRSALRSGGWAKLRAERRKQAFQTVKGKTGVPPFGRGALALIWKNMNIAIRTSGKAMIAIPIIVAAALAALKFFAAGELTVREIQVGATIMTAYLVFISSTIMLHSFRGDLKQANILRPMPIPAWQVIAAQGVHSTLMITAIAWIAMILVSVFYGFDAGGPFTMAVLALPFASYASLCWQAVAAVIYPNAEDPTQQYVANMLSGLAGLISIGPAIGIGALGWFLHLGMILPVMMIVGFSTAMAVGGIALSSHLYKRFDPTDE